MDQLAVILDFLQEVDQDFPVPVSSKVSLSELAKKYCECATLCCEYDNNKIIAMVAGYTVNTPENIGYISLVATRKAVRRKGLSSSLIKRFLIIAKASGLKAVHVYTHKTNQHAVRMYQKLGFSFYYPTDEPRPEDIHLLLEF